MQSDVSKTDTVEESQAVSNVKLRRSSISTLVVIGLALPAYYQYFGDGPLHKRDDTDVQINLGKYIGQENTRKGHQMPQLHIPRLFGTASQQQRSRDNPIMSPQRLRLTIILPTERDASCQCLSSSFLYLRIRSWIRHGPRPCRAHPSRERRRVSRCLLHPPHLGRR